jgi:predicted nuclease of predicted toxin-antitoxin system
VDTSVQREQVVGLGDATADALVVEVADQAGSSVVEQQVDFADAAAVDVPAPPTDGLVTGWFGYR